MTILARFLVVFYLEKFSCNVFLFLTILNNFIQPIKSRINKRVTYPFT